MKKTIRYKLTLMLAILLVMTIGFCLLINSTFLSSYYINSKKDTIKSAFEYIDYKMAEDTQSSEIEEELDELCLKYNLSIYVIDRSSQLIYTSVYNFSVLKERLYSYIFGVRTDDVQITDTLERGQNYVINTVYDNKAQAYYIETYGLFAGEIPFIMRIPISSIDESVKLANQFLMYVGIISLTISIGILWIFARHFTRPIEELSTIAKKMANLDFDTKYEGNNKDEIGILGNSMNELSMTLEKTISELKSANNELLVDLNKKIEIDEMRKDFLSNVSHELKTPLALIQGYAEGLKEGINDDAESREFYCEVIMDEAMKMNTLVKKLLTLNQIEFGQEQVEFERFDLTQLINGIINASRIITEQKQIRVIFNETEPVYVWADEYKVEEVLTNFFSNAINHIDFEKVIEIKMERRLDVIRTCVYNTGNKIPEEELDKVWIKFYKVDKARTREYGGSGIGLSIVKAIMDSFNRECGVYNRDNGVEFYMELDAKER